MKKQNKYEYLATTPRLPPDAQSNMMDNVQITNWLNDMASEGWDFVGHANKYWHGVDIPQQWWIFRREDL